MQRRSRWSESALSGLLGLTIAGGLVFGPPRAYGAIPTGSNSGTGVSLVFQPGTSTPPTLLTDDSGSEGENFAGVSANINLTVKPVPGALQGSTSVAVGTGTFANNVVAVFTDLTSFNGGQTGHAYSTDNGRTWTRPLTQPGGAALSGSPVLDTDPTTPGRVYLASLCPAGVCLLTSTDGGQTFGAPTKSFATPSCAGRPSIAVDGDSNPGFLYLTYTQYAGCPFTLPSNIMGVVCSPALGACSPPISLSGAGNFLGSSVTFGHTSTAIFAWLRRSAGLLSTYTAETTTCPVCPGPLFTCGPCSLPTPFHTVSVGAGNTSVFDAAATGICNTEALKGDFAFLPIPVLASDPSLVAGTRYVHVAVPARTSTNNLADIVYFRSADDGLTWPVGPTIVNDDRRSGNPNQRTSTDQFMPHLSVPKDDPSGRVNITYYDRRKDELNNRLIDLWHSETVDRGISWDASFKISETSFPAMPLPNTDPNRPCYWSNAAGHASHKRGDQLYNAWADDRRGYSDVYFALAHSTQVAQVQSPLDYGNVATVPVSSINEPGAKVLTFDVSNLGTMPLTVLSVACDPVNFGSPGFTDCIHFTMDADTPPGPANTPPTPVVLQPNAHMTFHARFTPGTAPAQFGNAAANGRGTIRIITDDPAADPLGVPLLATGFGAQPQLRSAAGPIDFGSTCVGSFKDQDLLLANDGTSILSITGGALLGVNAADFSASGLTVILPTSIYPGQQRTVKMRFQPLTIGIAKTATLQVNSNDPTTPVLNLGLSGTAGSGTLVVNPDPSSFGNVATTPVGGESGIKDVIFQAHNAGTCNLIVQSFTLGGANAADFSILGLQPPLPVTLSHDATFNFTMRFNPSATGARTATLQTSSDSGANPGVFALSPAVALDGVGAAPVINASVAGGHGSFGNVCVGSVVSRDIQILNQGTSNLTVTGVTVPNLVDFSFDPILPTFPVNLAPGAHLTMRLEFHPAAALPAIKNSGNITVQSSDPVTANFSLGNFSGTAGAGSISISPDPVSFGNVALDATGGQVDFKDLKVLVHNTGSCNFSIASLTFSGANPGDFSVLATNPGLPVNLSPDASYLFSVRFNPTATGARSATLDVTSDTGGAPGSVNSVTVNGVGSAPAINASPSSADFGDVCVGGVADIPVSILNQGYGSLSITSATITLGNASFAVVGSATFPLLLHPGESFDLVVRFAPTSPGAKVGNLQVVSNDPGSPLDIALSGDVGDGVLVLSPSPLSFGNVPVSSQGGEIDTKDMYLQVHNHGTCSLTITNLAAVGGDAGDFSVLATSPGFPLVLSPDATFNYTVRFNPNASGNRSTTLRATSDTGGVPGSSTDVAADGVGASPALNAAPNSANFASICVGGLADIPVSIINQGYGNLSISSASITLGNASFSILGSVTFPLLLHPGESFDLTVRFAPTSPGAKVGNLQIVSNDPGSPLNIPLGGTAPTSALVLTPITNSFGNVAVNPVGGELDYKDQLFTVLNQGACNLMVSGILASSGATADFSALATNPAFPVTLSPGATLPFTMRFNPSVAGARAAVFVVRSDSGLASGNFGTDTPFNVDGVGMGADINTVSGGTLSFDDVCVGGIKDIVIPIANQGNANLSISALSIIAGSADFTLISAGGGLQLPLILQPGSAIELNIRFAPATVGAKFGTLRISSNDADESTYDINLSGNAPSGVIVVTPDPLSFNNTPTTPVGGEVGTKDLTFHVHNSGACNAMVSSIFPTGGDAGDFTVLATNPGFPLTMSPDADFTFTLRFNPNGSGSRGSTLRVLSDAGENPGNFVTETDTEVDGTGAVPDINSSGRFDFATAPIEGDYKEVTVQYFNQGNANLQITGVSLSAKKSYLKLVAKPIVPAIIAPGSHVDITVRLLFKKAPRPPKNGGNGGQAFSVTVISNDPDEAVYKVPVYGAFGGR